MLNPIEATDSYKLSHFNMYPHGTERVFSYLESRPGAMFDETVFFGLQHIMKDITGQLVTDKAIWDASELAEKHMGKDLFNVQGWEHIRVAHDGRLPLRIRAVPEGTVVPTGNVLMTVENTDPECWWLTNALESYLTHVWYPSTVATLSRHCKTLIAAALERSGASQEGLKFMLHDFGYRGAATHDAAAIGGAGHLVNFAGTDTIPAMRLAIDSYGADLDTLAFSVPATEHSVMTAEGIEGEIPLVGRLLNEHRTGILSVVADSYNYYKFVHAVGQQLRHQIMTRDGVFVIRPDSCTQQHPTPDSLIIWTLNYLWEAIGGEKNEKGFKVIDPHVRVLWGDGLNPRKIGSILGALTLNNFSAENIAAFGMGGGLLQGVTRDTQRFAFKSSAQMRDGEWHDVSKTPLDTSKRSKPGRLELLRHQNGKFQTVREEQVEAAMMGGGEPVMDTVFENGRLTRVTSFDEIRARAALPVGTVA